MEGLDLGIGIRMKKSSFLASAILQFRAGCGGSDDTQVAEQTFKLKLLMKVIEVAEVGGWYLQY